jgi:hypothetical protein
VKKFQKMIYQKLDTLTRMFTAYFINRLQDEGIVIEKRKVIEGEAIEVVENYIHLAFPVLFDPTCPSISDLLTNNLVEFFKKICIPVIEMSDNWNLIKELATDKSLKIGFMELPENPPFFTVLVHDVYSGVIVRGTYGLLFRMDEQCFLFDMHMYLGKEEYEKISECIS